MLAATQSEELICCKHFGHGTFIVSTPPPPSRSAEGEGEVEPSTNFSKRGGGLTGSQFLEGVAGKEGGDLFQGVVVFT